MTRTGFRPSFMALNLGFRVPEFLVSFFWEVFSSNLFLSFRKVLLTVFYLLTGKCGARWHGGTSSEGVPEAADAEAPKDHGFWVDFSELCNNMLQYVYVGFIWHYGYDTILHDIWHLTLLDHTMNFQVRYLNLSIDDVSSGLVPASCSWASARPIQELAPSNWSHFITLYLYINIHALHIRNWLQAHNWCFASQAHGFRFEGLFIPFRCG